MGGTFKDIWSAGFIPFLASELLLLNYSWESDTKYACSCWSSWLPVAEKAIFNFRFYCIYHLVTTFWYKGGVFYLQAKEKNIWIELLKRCSFQLFPFFNIWLFELRVHLQKPSSFTSDFPEMCSSCATNLCWGTEKGLFHIMLHKPALNQGGWAIRGWTHCGPWGFSNMAATPTP